MNKYTCTVIFDAASTVIVEAETPEKAAQIAEEKAEGDQHLCHQCANTLETGDSIGVHVYNEECTERLLDTIYHPPQPAQKPWVGLTDEELRQIWYDDAPVEGGTYVDKLRQVESKLNEKNHG